MNYLILYCYYESDFSKNNLDFFLKNGFIDNEKFQFVIIINGETDNLELSNKKNLKVHKRPNDGYDFGAWGFGLNNSDYHKYDYFIFINSTSLGPFIPRYIPSDIKWPQLFTSKIDNVYKLCGPTINYLKNNEKLEGTHLQSFVFCTDIVGLELLIKNKVFSPEEKISRNDLILNHEIRMSQLIINNSYKLYSFQLSENKNSLSDEKHHGDIHYDNRYYGDTINPLEVMFIKSNRINNQTVKNYVDFLS